MAGRAPGALPGVVYLGMPAVVDDKEGVFGLVLLNHARDFDGEIQMRVIGRNSEDLCLITIVLLKTSLQILQLWKNE